ncbi:MAG: ABC transporter substrate-binding protein [Kineosporiaceae bacterium]
MRASPARLAVAVLTGGALLLAACGGGGDGEDSAGDGGATGGATEGGGGTTPVRLQLQWFAQAQFAGYYAAAAEGYYADEGLDVEILEGAVDIVPQQVVATGGAEFGVAWVPKALVSNTEDAGLVNVAQVFQRSGTLMVSWADSGVAEPADWAGRPVGNWGFGNEYELTAAIEQEGVEGVELVAQNFDMEALLNREIDAAQAMTYNEYAQLLETVDPETGELYQPEDFTVVDFNDVGTAMLQDALWVTEDYAAENGDTVEAFLRATFRGWALCRDEPDTCVGHVLDAGPTLGESHQTWQMNEVNKLIWPSTTAVGVMDTEQWTQTVEIASSQIPELEGQEIPDGSYTTEFAEAAVAALEEDGVDVTGEGWEPVEVELREGGE